MREAGYKYNRWTTGTAGQSIYLFLENDLYLYIYRELHRLSDIALGYGRKLHVQTQDLSTDIQRNAGCTDIYEFSCRHALIMCI